ncbi:conserved Plasmodium protein, unknown function [Plasmodium berghei]|uniref:Uncharacterized protein n=2 Tax=Plasmodium berghei TaxID=5821 RepID=A0A509APM9_PLABA|nr:conserved Plasmodium protein, unknown function [Plasmodium berghei ANKA]CXI69399.1 conserved Plasmodium protein, unknown function [Plasmodium berghei]SCM24232.1 conserved Plasmodium protein, unknown function [Plasmodium berghei]SCN27014.1 conserved Plasmodium protein, unknown function [Plasmodium berghei]SCO61459.1 conserved Plasmodium protein, unknown function [Plasmodium berghei]SCO63437.1 conserved Plasmodium protein, unknown function [Plasmodium berghei]|eukprot:XP_034422631.1 conserved Plasmodium protein, unknown function [Plasmodium berghei ANKA]
MNTLIMGLLANANKKLLQKIVISSGKTKNIDLVYGKDIIKMHLKKYVDLCNKFIELFIQLCELIKKLDKNFEEYDLQSFVMEMENRTLNGNNFLKKKEKDKFLKETQINIEKIIGDIKCNLLNTREYIKKIKELYLLIYIYIYNFYFNINMLDEYLQKNNIKNESNIINSNNDCTRQKSQTYNDVVNIKNKKESFENLLIENFINLNNICIFEFAEFISKDIFISLFYSYKDIAKISKKCLNWKNSERYHNVIDNINHDKISVTRLNEICFFFFMTVIIYYIENDLKLRIKMFTLLINNLHKNKLNLKKYNLILKHNPYLSKIKKLACIFL